MTVQPNPHLRHHQVLLLLVEHRASRKSFQALQSPAIPLTSFHDLPVPLLSSSIVLHHVLFSLPILLYPWGFQSDAVFSIALTSLRNVLILIYFTFHWSYIDVELVMYTFSIPIPSTTQRATPPLCQRRDVHMLLSDTCNPPPIFTPPPAPPKGTHLRPTTPTVPLYICILLHISNLIYM